MKTSKAIDEIKAAGHDISDEYSRAECIGFLNTAIHEVSGLLIAANSPMMVQEILIHDGESIPEHYVRAAGQYPMPGETLHSHRNDPILTGPVQATPTGDGGLHRGDRGYLRF